jgi:ABC-type sugar transport system ATPase subunit
MASVTLTDVTVDLDRRTILDRISVEVADGAFAAVVGPSGTGKSTLLRVVAGLVSPTAGTVAFAGRDVTRTKAADRDVGMVFQMPALLPNRNVRRNVQFPLELRHQLAEEIRMRVTAEARAMQIEHLLRRDPRHLSRGEQQLVQIARTMVRTPRVLLLDEPFAPLDPQLRVRLRSEIGTLQRGYGVTTLMATNDPTDAMALATSIIVLNGSPARVVQIGDPHDLHAEPATLDAATATGPVWTLDVRVYAEGSGFWLVGDGAVRLRSWAPTLRDYVGRTVTLGVRPEDLRRDDRGEATAILRRIVPGSDATLLCSWGGRTVTATGVAHGDEIGTSIALRVDRALVFDAGGRRVA